MIASPPSEACCIVWYTPSTGWTVQGALSGCARALARQQEGPPWVVLSLCRGKMLRTGNHKNKWHFIGTCHWTSIGHLQWTSTGKVTILWKLTWQLPWMAPTPFCAWASFRNGDDTVGNPQRARISRFELFEIVLLLTLDQLFPVEQFEATASRSTVPCPPAHFELWTLVQSARLASDP